MLRTTRHTWNIFLIDYDSPSSLVNFNVLDLHPLIRVGWLNLVFQSKLKLNHPSIQNI